MLLSTLIAIKLKKMKMTGHIARMGKRTYTYKTLVGKPEDKRPFELLVDRRIIIKWILMK